MIPAASHSGPKFICGVIEGFYGKQWSWSDRKDYADFLSRYGFDSYIYAPKGDLNFRKLWRETFPVKLKSDLQSLAQVYQSAGIQWGIGLSPLGLANDYNAVDATQIKRKVQEINELSPDILCILFDDVRGDIPQLAERQLRIIEDVLSVSEASRHIMCPTYYSFDPVLEDVFGKMPQGYLEQLGQLLPENVDVFWTGSHVIAKQFTRQDISNVSSVLGRAPVLWDNYPVNDGRLTSKFLHLKPFSGRPAQLKSWCRGHLSNPMNQPWLSRCVLESLAQIYQLRSTSSNKVAKMNSGGILSPALAQCIEKDLRIFHEQGLDNITVESCHALLERYRVFDEPAAQEVVGWLSGEYVFDPECLTE